MINSITKRILTMTTVAMATASLTLSAVAQDRPLRVGMGDIAGIESLNLLIAMERAKERGVDMEMTFFNSEDVAVQAVASRQADIGVGAPYAFLANSNAPVRMFFRMSTLQFFPVVNRNVYSGWEDLDGEEITVHSRGSGTEALMRLMEDQKGIQYERLSYVPGSEVRAGAMLQGTINATIVNAAAFNILQEQGDGQFMRLPVDNVNATDEALYAHQNILENRHDDLEIFVEELLRTWKDVDQDPSVVADLREQYNLLPDLPDSAVGDITMFFEQFVNQGVYPLDGGSRTDARDDVSFLSAAGQTDAPGDDFDPTRFWNFSVLDAVRN